MVQRWFSLRTIVTSHHLVCSNMSLESKFAFLSKVTGVTCAIAGSAVVVTSAGKKNFVEVLRNRKWELISSSDIESMTLVGFCIQADDRDVYGSRWAINWFNTAYPKKFFMTDSIVYHKVEDNPGGSSTLDKCTNYCDHGLRFGWNSEVYIKDI